MAVLLAPLAAGNDRAFAQISLNLPGISVVLPNITTTDVTVPAITVTVAGVATVSVPSVTLPGVSLVNTLDLTADLNLTANLNLPINTDVLLINLPGVSILAPALAHLSTLGSGVLGTVLNQVAPVNQQLAATTGTNLLGPVEQLLNGLTISDPTSPSRPIGALTASGLVAPLGIANFWTWNAVTIGSTDHAGFRFQAHDGGGLLAGSALPFRSIDKADLPGVLWDASSAFGLRRGMLHFGVTGGLAESDIQIKANAALRDIGITQAGAAELTSYSLGGFALLTTGSWYTGAVAGGGWGRSEIDNFLLGAHSDYRTSSFTSAWILGTIVPITSTLRFDVRGTLGYQRTVGDGHVDTLGIDYGDHVIEAATGSLSGRMFGVFRQGRLVIRPYLQAGLAHRFHYDNELQIEGIGFTFNDADTSVFAATGIDFEIAESLQLSAGVRQDHSPDFDSLSARFGLAVRLN